MTTIHFTQRSHFCSKISQQRPVPVRRDNESPWKYHQFRTEAKPVDLRITLKTNITEAFYYFKWIY